MELLAIPSFCFDRENMIELNWYSRLLHCVYKSRKDFKFSTQFISTTLVSALTIFQICMMLLSVVDLFRKVFVQEFRDNGDTLWANRWDVFYGGIEAGLVLSAVISILMLLHFMKCHREHVLQCYRGQTTFSQDVFLVPSALVGKSLRYSGYQIAFSLIGFFMLSIYLSFVAIALAIIFKGPEEVLGVKIWEALKDAGVAFIPTLALVIFLLLFQLFLARFVFCDSTYPNITVTIDNRQLFSILSYFFFFYNIIVGLTSCTIRILKGMLLGVIFISRIDRTSLIQGFQSWDKAFVAYVGFVTVLVAHRHPVMLVFCQLLIDRKSDQQSQEERPVCKPVYCTFGPETGGSSQEVRRPRMSQKAFNRWFLAVTLMRNPSLVNYRSRGRHFRASVVNLGSVNSGVPL
ncbi:stimulated by retinoic acid gene 6 protein-like [Stylophora pistillata]|uniref:stimulated by retinoic acid gene 6 protein-like n=1 Tax=Stylophora pistillata TaxID=50429 RepID=UPI000C053F82|nr:stimulated by retinoic acid gene 6 protein-like [Stylophora pistillata]